MDKVGSAPADDLVVGKLPRFSHLKVGMHASMSKIMTNADLVMFAGISGDTNPVHFDPDYALTTFFKGRIVHGMIGASLISAVLGTKLPGPGCIYMSQTLKFIAPVHIGDTVTARVTISDIDLEKRRLVMKTGCFVRDKPVIDGEARIWVPRREVIEVLDHQSKR